MNKKNRPAVEVPRRPREARRKTVDREPAIAYYLYGIAHNTAMMTYDLCVAWDWEHDAGFAYLLERACVRRGVSILQVTPGNLAEVVGLLEGGRAAFRTFFDRASETNAGFGPVVEWAHGHAARHINHFRLARRARNKAEMHEAVCGRVRTPPTIVLPPCAEHPSLPGMDLSPLGGCFTVKPAGGGGGVGVINGVTSVDAVLAARREFPSQRYLVQTYISPARLGSREAWFRVIYCAGKVYPCWWDVASHEYAPVAREEEERYGLEPLRRMASSLAGVSGLELFSTEIAFTPEEGFVVIDYVNDPLDLRLRSGAPDGVPDEIVRDIAETLLVEIVAPDDDVPDAVPDAVRVPSQVCL
jgi:hypothetical protein